MSRITDWVLDMEDNGEIELVQTQHLHPESPFFVDEDGIRKRWMKSVDESHYEFVSKEDTFPK